MPPLGGEFLELKVAKAFGLSPVEWRRQTVDDRALMMAYEIFCETCEAYRMEWHEQKRKDGGKKSVNPYHAMLKGMGIE